MRFVALLTMVGISVLARAQVKVYPRIETGTHLATVMRIDVDASERFLFSASEDKTARIWDLSSGKLLKVLRPPIGDGEEGMLYAVASDLLPRN
jgi:WD40 repeat protein